jgi:hypothetical protein
VPSGSVVRTTFAGADPRQESRGATALASVVLVSIAVSSLIVAGFSTARPRSDRLAVVFPPWWSQERSLATAAEIGPVSGIGALPFIVSISGADPRAYGRLVGAGAWAVLDGSRFSFCLSK